MPKLYNIQQALDKKNKQNLQQISKKNCQRNNFVKTKGLPYIQYGPSSKSYQKLNEQKLKEYLPDLYEQIQTTHKMYNPTNTFKLDLISSCLLTKQQSKLMDKYDKQCILLSQKFLVHPTKDVLKSAELMHNTFEELGMLILLKEQGIQVCQKMYQLNEFTIKLNFQQEKEKLSTEKKKTKKLQQNNMNVEENSQNQDEQDEWEDFQKVNSKTNVLFNNDDDNNNKKKRKNSFIFSDQKQKISHIKEDIQTEDSEQFSDEEEDENECTMDQSVQSKKEELSQKFGYKYGQFQGKGVYVNPQFQKEKFQRIDEVVTKTANQLEIKQFSNELFQKEQNNKKFITEKLISQFKKHLKLPALPNYEDYGFFAIELTNEILDNEFEQFKGMCQSFLVPNRVELIHKDPEYGFELYTVTKQREGPDFLWERSLVITASQCFKILEAYNSNDDRNIFQVLSSTGTTYDKLFNGKQQSIQQMENNQKASQMEIEEYKKKINKQEYERKSLQMGKISEEKHIKQVIEYLKALYPNDIITQPGFCRNNTIGFIGSTPDLVILEQHTNKPLTVVEMKNLSRWKYTFEEYKAQQDYKTNPYQHVFTDDEGNPQINPYSSVYIQMLIQMLTFGCYISYLFIVHNSECYVFELNMDFERIQQILDLLQEFYLKYFILERIFNTRLDKNSYLTMYELDHEQYEKLLETLQFQERREKILQYIEQ